MDWQLVASYFTVKSTDIFTVSEQSTKLNKTVDPGRKTFTADRAGELENHKIHLNLEELPAGKREITFTTGLACKTKSQNSV